MTVPASTEQTLKDEITELKLELSKAHAQISNNVTNSPPGPLPSHPLLLLTDSALPLGSFAFSSGLESYLAHHSPIHNAQASTLPHYLALSLRSLASTTLPYLLAAHANPGQLQDLDSQLDACTLCPVGKRASVAQGRALLTLWERALRSSSISSSRSSSDSSASSPARQALAEFSTAMKLASATPHADADLDADPDADEEAEELSPFPPQAHFPLIYAAVCSAMGLTPHETAYTFLLNHAKAVMSAGVRASVTGPYAAQALLASGWLKGEIEALMEKEWGKRVDEAGQSVVMVDVWLGRHELLYSRIFNS